MPSTRDSRVIRLTTALERNKPPEPDFSDIDHLACKVAECTDSRAAQPARHPASGVDKPG
ncbi:hypothetical protein GCM10007363_16660 [Pseudomonas fluvialis]|uniref:Uncharacterized protein n=1 Tax=Pseudomonas fluvialis TaxID=1793966 RepID=A0ABQ2AN38_9PSED|nr:hypothetical protein GCM10007363_16660 [Pseudomonas fluvialis]